MSTQRDELVADLARCGYSTRQIAATLATTTRTVQRARARIGIPGPPCSDPLSPTELQRAADMLDDGASYREVSRTLGRSDVGIARHFPGRSQWKPGSGISYQRLIRELNAIPSTAAVRLALEAS